MIVAFSPPVDGSLSNNSESLNANLDDNVLMGGLNGCGFELNL